MWLCFVLADLWATGGKDAREAAEPVIAAATGSLRVDTADGSGCTPPVAGVVGGGGGSCHGVGVALGSGVFGRDGTYRRYHGDGSGASVAVKELTVGADEESIGVSWLLRVLWSVCVVRCRGRSSCSAWCCVTVSLFSVRRRVVVLRPNSASLLCSRCSASLFCFVSVYASVSVSRFQLMVIVLGTSRG